MVGCVAAVAFIAIFHPLQISTLSCYCLEVHTCSHISIRRTKGKTAGGSVVSGQEVRPNQEFLVIDIVRITALIDPRSWEIGLLSRWSLVDIQSSCVVYAEEVPAPTDLARGTTWAWHIVIACSGKCCTVVKIVITEALSTLYNILAHAWGMRLNVLCNKSSSKQLRTYSIPAMVQPSLLHVATHVSMSSYCCLVAVV